MNVYNLIAIKEIRGEKVYNAVWNDYAEFFERGCETEPGDIIALDETSNKEVYIKASKNSKVIVGVHSDTFGHLIGGDNPTDDKDFFEYNIKKYIPVGLIGRVKVKINGNISKGDRITIDDNGIGKKAYNENNIIGICLENKFNEEVGLVKMLIL